MSSDALLAQAAPGVKTANFSTAGVTLGKARLLNTLFMRVIYIAAANASGANSWVFDCALSLDAGVSWFVITSGQPIVLSTVAQSGEQYLELDLNMPTINAAMANAPIVRLDGVVSGAGASPTINVTGVDIVPAWS
jgi:hypothetical protein